jgi:hypothetical protein
MEVEGEEEEIEKSKEERFKYRRGEDRDSRD